MRELAVFRRFFLASASLLAAQAFALADAARPAPLIAQACAGCHGQNGAGQGQTPPIAGVPKENFIQTWAAFRANERPATIMNRIARGYSDQEVAALAEYFASLR
jgi:sulfide dehydrogenase cytochrome subunit